MGVLSWIILGGLAGWLAGTMTGRRGAMDLLANIVVGVIGAFVGGFLGNLVGRTPVFGFTLTSFFVAVLGAVVFLALFSAIRR